MKKIKLILRWIQLKYEIYDLDNQRRNLYPGNGYSLKTYFIVLNAIKEVRKVKQKELNDLFK